MSIASRYKTAHFIVNRQSEVFVPLRSIIRTLVHSRHGSTQSVSPPQRTFAAASCLRHCHARKLALDGWITALTFHHLDDLKAWGDLTRPLFSVTLRSLTASSLAAHYPERKKRSLNKQAPCNSITYPITATIHQDFIGIKKDSHLI